MDFSLTIIFFGLGIGILVGMTGMGGGALMTPLLILLFGVSPTTAIGTDILYAAITKTVGGWRHLRMKTVNMSLVLWLAAGSVPGALFGVELISILQDRLGEERLDSLVYAMLGGTLLMVGIITLGRAVILARSIQEREDFELKLRHKVAAVVIGVTTGFVIGVTSAGSGTVVAVLLIAVYRLTPKRVVGTDVVHAAIVLWAAGIAHLGEGNVDLGLVGNILLGSVPGVVIGAALMGKVNQDVVRIGLGLVLMLSGILTVQKGDPLVWPIAAAVAGIGFTLILMAPRWYGRYRADDAASSGADGDGATRRPPPGDGSTP
jgi:uncharacterized membrane protein YfcA